MHLLERPQLAYDIVVSSTRYLFNMSGLCLIEFLSDCLPLSDPLLVIISKTNFSAHVAFLEMHR